MNLKGFIFLLLGIFLFQIANAQRKLPPPPVRVYRPTQQTSSKSATKVTYATQKKISNEVGGNAKKSKPIEKEWRQVFKSKIYTNVDSALLGYQSWVDKKNEINKSLENEYKLLASGFQKKSFETTAEFEARKNIAFNELKKKREASLSPVLSELAEFDEAVYVSKTNKFKVLFSDKDYDADAELWKFKILDASNNVYNFINIKIKPAAAERLWNNKEKIVLQQVADFKNNAIPLVLLTYPEQVSEDPLIFLYAPKIENSEMEDVRIGSVDQEGERNQVVYAKVQQSEGPVAPPSDEEETDKIFTSVQIQSTFPGGTDAWVKFLSRTLNRDLPVENGAPAGRYAVTVSFVVARDGSLSDVKAENDPGYGTAAEAVRVIQRGPKWTPAEQNGRKVIYRHRQAIVFQVTED